MPVYKINLNSINGRPKMWFILKRKKKDSTCKRSNPLTSICLLKPYDSKDGKRDKPTQLYYDQIVCMGSG